MAKHDDAYLRRITDYWRRVQVAAALESLKDERDGTDEEERKEKIIRASYSHEEFRLGKCPVAVYSQAFAKLDREREAAHQRALERNPNAEPLEPAKHIPVVFSPFALHIQGERDDVNILFGCALVDRSGNMSVEDVESDLPPVWVGRDFLAPSDGVENELFPLADADAYSNAISGKLRTLGTWPAEWQPMLRAFDEIWGNSSARGDKPQAIPLYESLKERYGVKPGWIRFERKDPKRIDIIRMYQKILERIDEKKTPVLYREAVLAEHANIFKQRKGELHLGQMGGKNPLAPSQRDSLLAFLQTPPRHISAINGPPGTGKTTLLQSVIATELVASALQKSEAPLYVAAAATNQAVSNIIRAFREATDELDHPLADRWIPGLKRRYGVYFRGSKGESTKLARGSLVCIPLQFNNHGREYNADDIVRLRVDIEKRNATGEEVAIDLLLPLTESPEVAAEFLQIASEKLKTKFGTLDEFLTEIHRRLVKITGRIQAYAKAADVFVEELRALDVVKYRTFESAERALALRLDGTQDRYQALVETIAREREQDDQTEWAERANEDGILDDFDERQRENEESVAQAEDATLSAIKNRIDNIEKVLKEYRPLRPPTSMFGWLAETLLPWVKNRKFIELQELARTMRRDKNGSIGSTITELRAFIESKSSGADNLEVQQDAIVSERAKRRALQASQRSDVVSQIAKARKNREIDLMARDAPRTQRLHEAKSAVEHALRATQSLESARSKFIGACPDEFTGEFPAFDKVRGKIDTTLRLEAFLLASHYWEGRFLRDARKTGWRSQANREAAFRLIAMLVPCFVSTFDKLGTSFNIMKGGETHPMWGFADALIIDEAGQASPDKGAFAFSFASKAIVVGDELQLPPVNSSDSVTILTSIAQSASLLNDEFAAKHGLMAGTVGIQKRPGSLMRMASQAAYFHATENTRGMWLRDHFRCDPRIIQYSNQIWYTGDTSLMPRRAEQKGLPLPHFGHMHVAGKAANNSNGAEALAIVRWVNEFGQMLQDHYDLPLHEIVAVLTPFKNQKTAFQTLRDKSFKWNRSYESPSNITMGTVHALQGAERPVIIFSTVYDEPKSRYFFDSEHTMLNVAVSRAKDSFIVFGNKRLFVPGREEVNRPSTFLTAHLFNAELQAVPQVPEAS